ncbi:MAG TPA: WcaF family extracellular polysaccharide biosynthesis acetyltransferase [Saprospiraceae bacterium]|nr:WcaF family extracellular polysaccharide biosynthesis acetyltransferase [Saprospiraceae bacterium]HMQ85775.1 WcaF family extracellular polysaccharide biosynthesis acetyltransferase [Saprospiraceae bacterium]
MNKTDLSTFDNSWYDPGAGIVKRALWYCINAIFFVPAWNPFSQLKCVLLRCFGAKVGQNVVIKPGVNIKYPWKLCIADDVWIGENAWLDNLDNIFIEKNVCISQGALLLCGNHDYTKPTFDLITGKIVLKEGVWIGAKAIVTGGVTCHSHAVLAVGSIASKDLEAYWVYQGNPAIKKRLRTISTKKK